LKSLVLDASIALAFCLADEREDISRSTLRQLEESILLVPSHWWIEITNALLQATRRKRITAAERQDCFHLLMALNLKVIEMSPHTITEEVIQLAELYKLTAYDACYLHIAIQQDIALATLDKALQSAANSSDINVVH